MKKKLIVIILVVIFSIFIAGCSGVIKPDTSETVTNQPAYSETQVKEIVNAVLEKGEFANLLAGDRFRSTGKFVSGGFHEIDTEDQGGSMSGSAEIVQQVKSTDDIKQYFYGTFTKDAADIFLKTLFGDPPLYKDVDGKLYINNNVVSHYLIRCNWLSDNLAILQNTPNQIVVEMDVKFFIQPSDIQRRSLTLIREGDQWLMTESFVPVEYAPETASQNQPAYSEEKVKEIVSTCLERGKFADLLANADFLTTGKSEKVLKAEFAKIDRDKQQSWFPPETLSMLQQINNTDDIRQYFYNTFTRDIADYFSNILISSSPCYKDINGKLYENLSIAAFPFLMDEWMPDSLAIVQNTQNQIVVEDGCEGR